MKINFYNKYFGVYTRGFHQLVFAEAGVPRDVQSRPKSYFFEHLNFSPLLKNDIYV